MKHRFAELLTGTVDPVLLAEELLDPVVDWSWSERDESLADDRIEIPTTVAACVKLPEHYEVGYNYPVVIWLLDSPARVAEINQLLPQISDRNYIGIGVAAMGVSPNPLQPDEMLPNELTGALLDQLLDAVCLSHPIHRDRVYLVGEGAQGAKAVELLLQEPGLFAGAVNLQGNFPEMTAPLRKFRQLQGRRVLLSTRTTDRSQPLGDLIESSRMLYSAGMQVGARVYRLPKGTARGKMLRDIDHWIMDAIQSAIRA